MSASPAVTLEVIPCIDSLLYAPFHIAIASLVHRSTTKTVDVGACEVELKGLPRPDDTLKIRYAPAVNGDKRVIEEVKVHPTSPSTLRIGLCDPLSVVAKNYDLLHNSASPLHEIHAVFIDKISLSLFARVPPKRRPTGPKATDELLKREHLKRLIAMLEKDEINYPERFKPDIATSRIICDFWGAGETTKFIVEHFLELSKADYKYHKMPNPDFDLGPLTEGNVDLAITHAPWSLNWKQYYDKVRLFTRECFPSIQFPFSCMVAPAMSLQPEATRERYRELLEALLREVRVAILLLHHAPTVAKTILNQNMKFFRHYGLGDPGYTESTITRALNHFLVTGCFSGDLNPDWSSWLQAFLMDKEWKSRVIDGSAWDALDVTLNHELSGKVRDRNANAQACFTRLNDLCIAPPRIASSGT